MFVRRCVNSGTDKKSTIPESLISDEQNAFRLGKMIKTSKIAFENGFQTPKNRNGEHGRLGYAFEPSGNFNIRSPDF